MFSPIAVLAFALANVMAGCIDAAQATNYVEGELLVKFRTGVSEERIAEINRTLGSRVLESWTAIRWYRVLLKEGVTVPEGIQKYQSLKEVEAVEPNSRTQALPPQGPPTRLPQ